LKIAVIRYNAGNIQSVLNALERLGVAAILTDDPAEIRAAERVIFPGVGEASTAMRYLRERGLDEVIRSLTQPVLGICLGMQLLGEHSEENDTECLGIVPARVRKLPNGDGLKVPHVGWNTVQAIDNQLFENITPNPYFYFVHSFAMELNEATIAQTDYGIQFTSAVQWRNFYGVQFHPEKSAGAGEQLLRNFIWNSIEIGNSFPKVANFRKAVANFDTVPAMDLINNHCVRLRQGDFAQRTDYAADPVAVAKQFEATGFQRLHMVDLDGARAGKPQHLHILQRVAAETSLIIDFSGGIKTDADIEAVFVAGAAMAAIGSVAVKDKPLFFKWLQKYGPEKTLLGVDVRDEKLAISGWLEQTEIGLFEFLEEMAGAGVRQVFCTDIGRDGLLTGPSTELYQRVLAQFPGLRLIASGGVSKPEDLAELAAIGCTGAIVGKAIYEDFENLKNWL
jgi:phosphoribosylformimino-5-aminoimidazole carboxamide ribotide isomerase